jgi:hypothetical protein
VKATTLRTVLALASLGLVLPARDVCAAEAPTAKTVTQHGITWTLDRDYPVGRHVNGDWWVVGPVTVLAAAPASTGSGEDARNGSAIDPAPTRDQGYDGRARGYNGDLSIEFPVRLEPGQSLVSTISHQTTPNPEIFPHFEKASGVLRTAAVLTVVAEPPPADAFRPPFVGREKPLLQAGGLRRDRLPRLAVVPGVPDMADIEKIFTRPWLDHIPNWSVRMIHPTENMPGYGREIARGSGFGALMLCLDLEPAEKERLLIGYVQTGIDLYYTAKAGGGWRANGGHGSGRKLPILVAGLMLGSKEMLAVEAEFGEDMQTYYGKGWTGATALWQIVRRSGLQPPHEHLRPAAWAAARPEGYRRCCNAVAWVGQALAARHLGLVEHWRHDAFFDYVDRWMTEVDTPEIRAAFRESKIEGIRRLPDGVASGTVWDAWVKDMWVRYRGPIEPLHASTEILDLIRAGKPLPQ